MTDAERIIRIVKMLAEDAREELAAGMREAGVQEREYTMNAYSQVAQAMGAPKTYLAEIVPMDRFIARLQELIDEQA